MNRLILIRGPICSGKSTTANYLRDLIEPCTLIDQDVLKRQIDREQPSDWRDGIAFDTTLFMADLLMKRGRDIIADIHSSVPRQYEDYAKLAVRNHYQLFSFLLYPPLETCLERNTTRDIPDVLYKITAEDIKKYWNNPYQVSGEITFDSSLLKTEEIAKEIFRVIQG